MSQKEWLSSFEWDTRPQGFLSLRNSDMERICRYLPTQRDRYEACLVHPTWLKAATDVLWEAPEFRDPKSFQRFLFSASSYKRLALAVRTLSLVLRDEEFQTMFRPLMDSELPRHTKKDIVLACPDLIMHFARQCEKTKHLKIYGWQLEPRMLAAICMVLTDLEGITLVGASPSFNGIFMQRNLLARLKELRLDGHFVIEKEFADLISTRAQNLKTLQIPLTGMEREALIRLCSGNLDLEQITLTKAKNMGDDDVQGVLQSFPNLRVFILEGTSYVTTNSIIIALNACTYLRHFEIRGNEASLQQPATGLPSLAARRKITRHTNLQTLIMENLNLPADIITQLPTLPRLATLALRNCMQIDDTLLISALAQTSRLTTIQLIDCTGLTDKVLQQLWEGYSKSTIRQVHIERCGLIKPWAVYQLCCKCANTLKLLRLVGYKNITDSVLKDYALKNTDTDTITLDEQMIDALVNVDPEYLQDIMELPKDRRLTGEQIVMLAKILKLSISELEKAMDRVERESKSTEKVSGHTCTTRDPKPLQNKHLSRVTSFNKGLSNQRPTTPALWATANDSAIDKYLPNGTTLMATNAQSTRPRAISQYSVDAMPLMEQTKASSPKSPMSRSESSASLGSPERTTSPEFEEETKYDSGDMSNELEESKYESDSNEYEVGNTAYQEANNAYDMGGSDEPAPAVIMNEWPPLTDTKLSKQTKELDLGGWGSATSLPWAKKGPAAAVSSPRTTSEPSSSTQHWTPHTLERHQNEWQPVALEPAVPKRVQRRGNNPRIMSLESEGWGTPKSYVPWNDLRQQGYAYDVLEEQKKTKFWDNSGGKWKVLNPDEPVPASQVTVPRQPTGPINLTTDHWPHIETAAATQQQPSPIPTPSSRSAPRTQRPSDNDYPEPIPQSEETYAAAELSSDDEVIDWEKDDGITIKTSPSLTHRAIYGKGPQKTPVPDQPRAKKTTPVNGSGPSRRDPPPGKLAGRWGEPIDIIDLPTATRRDKRENSTSNIDFLIDTSDVVKKVDDFEDVANHRQTSSFESTFWQDMSSLSSPMHEQFKSEFAAAAASTQQEPPPPSARVTTPVKQSITPTPPSLPPALVPSPAPPAAAPSVTNPTNDHDVVSDDHQVEGTPADMLSSTLDDSALEEALVPTVVGSSSRPSSPPEPAASTLPVAPKTEGTTSPPPPPPLSPSRPASVTASPQPNEDTSATASTPASAATTAAPAASSASPAPPKHKKLGSFRFELPDRDDLPPLQVYQDVPLKDSIDEYCKEHDIEKLADFMYKTLKDRYTALHTNKVLNKANAVRKKKKKKEESADLL